MNVVNIIHNKAIEFADEAIIAKYKGSADTARILYFKAFQLEKEAALNISQDTEDKIPRHILIRSAASLAMLSEQYEEAEKLITLGLSSTPPDFIKEELLELTKELKKKKKEHLHTEVIQLTGFFTSVNATENEIKIQDAHQPFVHTIIAPTELIKEMVKKYFLDKVNVKVSVSTSGLMMMTEMRAAA